MADVQHIEPSYYDYDSQNGNFKKGDSSGAMVITKHTKWNFENDCWENAIHLTKDEYDSFRGSFNLFRRELECIKSGN